MKNNLGYMQDILNQSVSGFHELILSDSARLGFVSQNFCEMAGYTKEELPSAEEGDYASFVHPADKEKYARFIQELKTEEQTQTCEYRLVKKGGSVIYVKDTASSRKLDDGRMVAYSVLADITEIISENHNLQFLNETIPCGFLKYTCEKQPKITYLNKQMMDLLRFPKTRGGELDYLELYKKDIFLMVPMEERQKFASYLKQVYAAGIPLTGEMELLCCDGAKIHVFGWIIKSVNEQGIEEFQSVCMDVTKRHQAQKEDETKRYLKALADVYDKIFEYNLSSDTVTCLYSDNSPMFRWLENVPMQMADATEKWIAATVDPQDSERVGMFFQDFFQKKLYQSEEKPPQITYHSRSSGGEMNLYSGIFLKMDESVSLYCCRCLADVQETDSLRSENTFLKENMQELMMRFTDGVAAFELRDEFVTPLYASDNVCEFFGFTNEEWISLMGKSTPSKEFVARSNVAYEDFAELLMNGEAEFTYLDLKTASERRIRAICSRKLPGSSSPRYVMLYDIGSPEAASASKPCAEPAVSIRTFGYFDVFVGEKPIAFRNKKAKELFALLVDRRGGYISSEEAISFLWEDDPVNPVTLSRYRKVALRLKNTLAEYGISGIMETVDGKRRIVAEKVRCDLYDYLSGGKEYEQLFKGSYLNNYSWGENTLAELTGDIL